MPITGGRGKVAGNQIVDTAAHDLTHSAPLLTRHAPEREMLRLGQKKIDELLFHG